MTAGKEKVSKLKLTKMQLRQERTAYLFIVPALIMFVIFVVLPIIMAIYLSLCDYSQTNLTKIEWAGFENYLTVFFADGASTFRQSLVNVFIYALMYVPLVVSISLLFAVLVNQKLKGAKVFRVLYYIPSVTSGVAAAFVFKFIFDAAEYGLMNQFISAFGGKPMDWLGTEGWAMFCIVLINVWGGIGGNMIIYLAAIQGVSPDIIEAARVDGANKWQIFKKILLPQLATATFFIVMMSIIGAFQLYDQVKIMTGGGSNTVTPVFQIFFVAFDSRKSGLANAMAIVLFVLIIIVTSINNWVQDKMNAKYN